MQNLGDATKSIARNTLKAWIQQRFPRIWLELKRFKTLWAQRHNYSVGKLIPNQHSGYKTIMNQINHGIARVNNSNIKVSVVINYYSKESTIHTVLERLRKQSLILCSQDEIEIILVDDGTEGEDLYKKLPDDVIYIWQRKYGYGICRAKNIGAKIANGKYIIFLDADILVSETFIDSVLRGFHKYGDRIVQCAYIWDYHFQGCPDPRTEFGVWENPDCLTGRFYQVAGGNMAISQALFIESKGFDEELIYGGVEDLLFGYQISLLPQTAVYFNREMQSWHIPHPPSPAHANPQKSWNVVKRKYPDFYDQYIVRGLR